MTSVTAWKSANYQMRTQPTWYNSWLVAFTAIADEGEAVTTCGAVRAALLRQRLQSLLSSAPASFLPFAAMACARVLFCFALHALNDNLVSSAVCAAHDLRTATQVSICSTSPPAALPSNHGRHDVQHHVACTIKLTFKHTKYIVLPWQ